MDQTKGQKFHSCAEHSKKKLKFVQVNEVKSDADSNLFYCTDCINEDIGFQGKNYLLIEQIIQKGEDSIIQKWPPVNDYSLFMKLVKETSKFDQSQHIIQKITNYFTVLKDEVIRKIEFCQKKMINHAENLPFGKNQIIKQYQEISQISQLRSLIIECKNDKSFQQQLTTEKFKNFIIEVGLKKQENTQKLQRLLDQSIKQQYLINQELPNMIKEQIFSFIDKINFFNQDILNDQNPILDKIRIQTENKYNFSTKLMSLISNKSNFCSSEFLNSIKQQLDMLNPFLESVVDQNMFIKGKQPIEFQQLSEEKMNKISEYVKHVVQMQNNTNYEKFVQQSQYIKDLQKIMQNKLNFISEISKKTIMNHLIETYPYLLNRGNTQIIQQQDKFETFNQLDDQMIDDLFLLMKQKQQIQNSHNVSKTNEIKNLYKFELFNRKHLNRIFNEFPIFDIIPQKGKSILNDLQLVKGTFNDGDQRIQILKNYLNQYEITINEENYKGNKRDSQANCMSNMILEKDKKYIFRVQFKSICNQNYFQIGLMQKKNLNIQKGCQEQYFAQFEIENGKIKLDCKRFTNYLKGKDLNLNNLSTIFELRVWLNGQIMQISDFPDNNYIISINNEKLQELKSVQNLSFFQQLYNQQDTYILTEALVVEEFDD